jgi:hypothetical protein
MKIVILHWYVLLCIDSAIFKIKIKNADVARCTSLFEIRYYFDLILIHASSVIKELLMSLFVLFYIKWFYL